MCVPTDRFALASPGYGMEAARPHSGGGGTAATGHGPAAAIDPKLPKRRRKSLGSPTVEWLRLVTGTAGLARLGHSLVARSVNSAYSIGALVHGLLLRRQSGVRAGT